MASYCASSHTFYLWLVFGCFPTLPFLAQRQHPCQEVYSCCISL